MSKGIINACYNLLPLMKGKSVVWKTVIHQLTEDNSEVSSGKQGQLYSIYIIKKVICK